MTPTGSPAPPSGDGAGVSAPRGGGCLSHESGVVSLTDGAGATLATWSYDPYGKPMSSTVSTTALLPNLALVSRIARLQVLRYAGYVYDEPSGLYYLSQRYYDPGTCQFISRDPVGADGEESAYQYCGGDPIGNTDPSGAFSIGDVFNFAKKAVAAVVKTAKRAVTWVKAVAKAAVAVVSAIVGKPSAGAKASAKKTSTTKTTTKPKAVSAARLSAKPADAAASPDPPATETPHVADSRGLLDINFTTGVVGGVSIGVQIATDGLYGYIGGAVTAGPSGSAMGSPSYASEGWQVAVQGGNVGGVTAGTTLGERLDSPALGMPEGAMQFLDSPRDKSTYWGTGGFWPPGASVHLVHSHRLVSW
jgi:RHS repeat-associated protein